MPSWPFQLEGRVFDGVEVIPMGHVYMKDKILNPDPRVCCSVICLYVHGFEPLWKFVVQHLVGETQGVRGPSEPGHVVACCRRLLYPGLIPNWYLISMIILLTTILCQSAPSGPIDGPGRTNLFVQELT